MREIALTIRSAEMRDQIATRVCEIAKEAPRERVTRRMIERDKQLPSLTMILWAFEATKLDEVLRALELWPERPEPDELIWSLRRFYIKWQHSPAIRDTEVGNLPYSANAYTAKFGTWNKALESAGLPYRKAAGGWAHHDPRWDNVTRAEAIRYLRRTFGEKGVLPTIEDYEKGKYFYPVYVLTRLFRTWVGVAKAAHLRRATQDRVSDEEILRELERLYGDTRILPTVEDYTKSNPKYTYALCCQRFISWRELAKRLDYRLASKLPNSEYSAEKVLAYLKERYKETGVLPLGRTYKASEPKYSYELCAKLFGNWRNTAVRAGLRLESDIMPRMVKSKTDPADDSNVA